MSDDLQKEPPVASGVGSLAARRPAKRDTAKNKRSDVVSKFLLVLITPLADQSDGFQVFKLALGETDGRQYGLGRKHVAPDAVDVGVWSRRVLLVCAKSVPKVYVMGGKGVRL